jgi:NCAIR mutase (PurE)-related protein
MNEEKLRDLLIKVKSGEETLEAAVASLKDLPFTDLGFAMVDNHRQLRNGYPEVIYCEGKTAEQVATIMSHISQKGTNVLGTRATQAMYDIVKETLPEAIYNPLGRTIQLISEPLKETETYIAIVCAGTSDLPVVEEAYETARLLGNKVIKVTDVGVAGIHRLLSKMDLIRNARVVIVVAGMEGALASVVGGLVDKPVIAVPTSVGYGASFGGVSALLTMLNSCASGVSVVNIDNGFGAAYCASMINQLK